MKISSIKLDINPVGLEPFYVPELGDIVILAGSNGSGKTRLLKLIESHIRGLQAGQSGGSLILNVCPHCGKPSNEELLTTDNANAHKLELVNYSHFDAQLQLPNKFPPYVICKAKELLKTCNYEETALNSLLLLMDMAKGYSEEFKDIAKFDHFVSDMANPLGLQIDVDENRNLKLFNQDIETAALSPGQQYLLRIAVACYCNLQHTGLVFILDEPELHLHPQALITLVKTLRSKFQDTQFWISTHSLELISYLVVAEKETTVLCLKHGETSILRSDSSDLLDGLIGAEENLFAIRQLMTTPDEYACNRFTAECANTPDVKGVASGKDPQAELVQNVFELGDVVVDFGAGKGRFLEELALSFGSEIARGIEYYAYDISAEHAQECKHIMEKYGSTSDNYFNELNELLSQVNARADYVLLVNVLHEIDPQYWQEIFRSIYNLLKEEGELIIIERQELTVGEAPYENGFIMITKNSAEKLFGVDHCTYFKHPKKDYIIKHHVQRKGLEIKRDAVESCITEIKKEALMQISSLKQSGFSKSDLEKYKIGIKLAFWLHQYANASLVLAEHNLKC